MYQNRNYVKSEDFLGHLETLIAHTKAQKKILSVQKLSMLLNLAKAHKINYENEYGKDAYKAQLKKYGPFKLTPIGYLQGQLKLHRAKPRENYYACSFSQADLDNAKALIRNRRANRDPQQAIPLRAPTIPQGNLQR